MVVIYLYFPEVREKELQLKGTKMEKEIEVAGFYQMQRQIESLRLFVQKTINKPKHIVPFLAAGRLLVVS